MFFDKYFDKFLVLLSLKAIILLSLIIKLGVIMIYQATAALKSFVDTCKTTQQIWALRCPDSKDWVVCDSIEFSDTDVLPLWSDKQQAQDYCTDEWQGYEVCTISVDEYLEHWVTDLNYDGVLLGINWLVDEGFSVEIDPIDVAKAFAEYEIPEDMTAKM